LRNTENMNSCKSTIARVELDFIRLLFIIGYYA